MGKAGLGKSTFLEKNLFDFKETIKKLGSVCGVESIPQRVVEIKKSKIEI